MIYYREKNGGDAIPDPESTSQLKAILRQHWEHSRHCEIQILWFTNIYAIIIAAMLVFIGEAVHSDSPDFSSAILLALFGLVLSVIGFLITVALTLGHLNHKMNVMMILYWWNKTEFYIDPKKPVHYKTIHRWFFEITIALFASLLLFYSFKSWTYSTEREQTVLFILVTVIVFGAIFGVISYVIDALYRDRWRKYSGKRVNFLKALRNDTERHYEKKWDNLFRPPKSLEELIKSIADEKILKPDGDP